MRGTLCTISAGLAIIGMISAIGGVTSEQFKPVLIGFVMLAGAGVFALLHIGARAIAARSASPYDSSVGQEIET